MFFTILKDKLPRGVSYPVTDRMLHDELEGIVSHEELGVYFVYNSCTQVEHYDPATSGDARYTVMVLRNGLPELRVSTMAGDLADNPAARSILVFPVKTRLKSMIANAIVDSWIQPIKNWLAVAPGPDNGQKDLLLAYDSTTQAVSAKFCRSWDGPESGRIYT